MQLHSVKGSVIRPDELDSKLVDRWVEIQAKQPQLTSPFLAPEFTVAFGKHFDNARVAVFEADGEVVGFLPYEQGRYRVARGLGNGLVDVQAVVGLPELDIDISAVLDLTGNDVFEFDRLLDNQLPADGARHLDMHRSPVIDLSGGYEDWVAEKFRPSKGRVRRILQRQRQLNREVGTVEFEFASTSRTDLERLMDWKSSQYRRTGRPDRFARSNIRNLIIDLFETTTDRFQMVLSKCSAGDQTLAFDLALRNHQRIAGWFPAYNTDYTRYSPGNICSLQQLEHAAANGITHVDLGAGDAAYKDSFSSYDMMLASGSSDRPSLAATTRRCLTAPRRAAMSLVLASPQLRTSARATLEHLGTLRNGIRRKS